MLYIVILITLFILDKINIINMNTTSPGLPLVKENKLNLQKCVICQNAKDKRCDKKLTSTEKGRQTLIECSKAPQDDFLVNST